MFRVTRNTVRNFAKAHRAWRRPRENHRQVRNTIGKSQSWPWTSTDTSRNLSAKRWPVATVVILELPAMRWRWSHTTLCGQRMAHRRSLGSCQTNCQSYTMSWMSMMSMHVLILQWSFWVLFTESLLEGLTSTIHTLVWARSKSLTEKSGCSSIRTRAKWETKVRVCRLNMLQLWVILELNFCISRKRHRKSKVPWTSSGCEAQTWLLSYCKMAPNKHS